MAVPRVVRRVRSPPTLQGPSADHAGPVGLRASPERSISTGGKPVRFEDAHAPFPIWGRLRYSKLRFKADVITQGDWMTKDVQLDRSASPLASVSDEIHPNQPKPVPDGPAEIQPPASADDPESAMAHVESFEGFSSFG